MISLFNFFSPEIRKLKAENLRLREMYAAAKTTRLTGAWNPGGADVNSVIGASSPLIRARVRQLVRDFPYFQRAVNTLCDFTVGSGILFQSKNRLANGSLHKSLNQKIEDGLNAWAERADYAGKLHYYEIMELAKRQYYEAGEYLLVYQFDKKDKFPLRLQSIEPDQLDASATAAGSSTTVSQGVEIDASGKPVAYHIMDDYASYRTITRRIPAERVLHGFKVLRPGQLRGISPFASGVLLAKDLDDYMGAEIDGAKMASKWLAFIKKDSLYTGGGLPSSGTSTDINGNTIEELENAVIEYLNPGEDVQISANPRPGANFTPFVRLLLCMFSVSTGVPYELISGDYSGMNYTTLRGVRNDFAHTLKPQITHHIRHFCIPTYQAAISAAELAGGLVLPKYSSFPERYHRAEWHPPGMASIDPLKETKADAEAVTRGFKSPQEIVKARGRDIEEVYAEIKAAKDMADALGLEFGETSTAMQTAPSAMENEDENNG